jgi:hypothetical protein
MQARLTTLILCCLSLIEPAFGQSVERLRGTITAVDGDTFSLRSNDGKTTAVRVTSKSEVVVNQPIKITEIKPGDFLAVTSAKGSDGSLTAIEVRRFPKPSNPGHRPFSGVNDQTMTNATVSAMVESAAGRELTLVYDGGSQKIVVPEKTAISMLVDGDRTQLKTGGRVNLTATPSDQGVLNAVRIQLTP